MSLLPLDRRAKIIARPEEQMHHTSGGSIAYRSSKAAVNMVMRSAASTRISHIRFLMGEQPDVPFALGLPFDNRSADPNQQNFEDWGGCFLGF